MGNEMGVTVRPDTRSKVDTRSKEEVALANEYANQHERLENFIFMYAIPARLFDKLGVEFHSFRGYSLLFVTFFLAILIPGLIISSLTNWSPDLPPARIAVMAVALAVLNVFALIFAQAAAFKISALHRLLKGLEQIRALMAWDRIWFGPKMSAIMGGSMAVGLLVILYLLNLSVSGISLSAAVLWICAVITVFLGQFSFSTVMIFFEFRKLSTCRFELYRLDPFETYALQRTSVGLKQLGLVSIMSLPFFLLALLVTLPEGSALNIPITAGFLFLSYLATAIGILFPLGFLGDVVRAEKWRVLEPLQANLNQLAEELQQNLSKVDYEYFEHLHGFYQSLRDTRDSFLSLGALARIAGGLLLSTVTVLLPSILKEFLDKLI